MAPPIRSAGAKRPETFSSPREAQRARTERAPAEEPLAGLLTNPPHERGLFFSADLLKEVTAFLTKRDVRVLSETCRIPDPRELKEIALSGRKIPVLHDLRFLYDILPVGVAIPGSLELVSTIEDEIRRWREADHSTFAQNAAGARNTCHRILATLVECPKEILYILTDDRTKDGLQYVHFKKELETADSILAYRNSQEDFLVNRDNPELEELCMKHLGKLLRITCYESQNGELGFALLQHAIPLLELELIEFDRMTLGSHLGKCYTITGDLESAVRILPHLPDEPTKFEALFQLANSSIEIGDDETALRLTKAIISDYEDQLRAEDADIISDTVKLLFRNERILQAEEIATALDPQYGDEAEVFIDLLIEHGDYERAKDFAQDQDLLPSCVLAFARRSNYIEVASVITRITDLGEDVPRFALIIHLLRDEHFEEARGLYEQIIREQGPMYLQARMHQDFLVGQQMSTVLHTFNPPMDYIHPPAFLCDAEVIQSFAEILETNQLKHVFFLQLLKQFISLPVLECIKPFYERYNSQATPLIACHIARLKSFEELRDYVEGLALPSHEKKRVLFQAIHGSILRPRFDPQRFLFLSAQLPSKDIARLIGSLHLGVNPPLTKKLLPYISAYFRENPIIRDRIDIHDRKRYAIRIYSTTPRIPLLGVLPEIREDAEIAAGCVNTLCLEKKLGTAINFITQYLAWNPEKQEEAYASVLNQAMRTKGEDVAKLVRLIPDSERGRAMIERLGCLCL